MTGVGTAAAGATPMMTTMSLEARAAIAMTTRMTTTTTTGAKVEEEEAETATTMMIAQYVAAHVNGAGRAVVTDDEAAREARAQTRIWEIRTTMQSGRRR